VEVVHVCRDGGHFRQEGHHVAQGDYHVLQEVRAIGGLHAKGEGKKRKEKREKTERNEKENPSAKAGEQKHLMDKTIQISSIQFDKSCLCDKPGQLFSRLI
jgi:hypothetical protein